MRIRWLDDFNAKPSVPLLDQFLRGVADLGSLTPNPSHAIILGNWLKVEMVDVEITDQTLARWVQDHWGNLEDPLLSPGAWCEAAHLCNSDFIFDAPPLPLATQELCLRLQDTSYFLSQLGTAPSNDPHYWALSCLAHHQEHLRDKTFWLGECSLWKRPLFFWRGTAAVNGAHLATDATTESVAEAFLLWEQAINNLPEEKIANAMTFWQRAFRMLNLPTIRPELRAELARQRTGL